MARYAVIEGGIVANIVEAEADFAATQGWVEAGPARIGDVWDGSSFTSPPPPPPPVPAAVTNKQARLQLLAAGVLAQVDPIIDAMSEPAQTQARIEWEYATEIHRAHPLVAGIGAALNLTDAQIDDLFRAAATL